jgi:hypothetical protein
LREEICYVLYHRPLIFLRKYKLDRLTEPLLAEQRNLGNVC